MMAMDDCAGDDPAADPLADGEWLRRFARHGDESAFAAVVRRHSGLIFSTALRRSGSPELAEEAAQNVLAALARKAGRLASLRSLAPWLHRAAVLEAAALLRRETRYREALRRNQEESSSMTQTFFPDHTKAWEAVRPLVDEELDALSHDDREVLLWHHVEGRTFRDIATRLGVSAEAAQRRGHRALEKLATRLRRRGVAVPVALLGGALTTGLMGEAAAAGGPAALTSQALVQAHAVAAASSWTAPAWVASPAALAAVGLLSGSLPLWWQASTARPETAALASAAHVSSQASVSSHAPENPPAPGVNAETRLSYLRQAIEHLKTTDPETTPTKLDLQLRRFMLTLSAEDLADVGRMLRDAPRAHRGLAQVIAAFSTRLAELEPDLALELAQASDGQHPNAGFAKSIDKNSLLDALVRNHTAAFRKAIETDKEFGFSALGAWAGHDPVAAMEYAETSYEGEQRLAGYNKCLQPWLLNDPAAAFHWLDAHAVEKPEVVAYVDSYIGLGAWLAMGLPPVQAVALAGSLEDPLLRNKLIESAFNHYRARHPETLAGFAPFLRAEDGGKPASVGDVVSYWRKKDEAGVAAWVEGLPEGTVKTAARRHLAAPVSFDTPQP